MTTSTWTKLGLTVAALLVTGQTCTINLGTSRQLDGGVFRSDDHGQTWVQKNFVRQEKNRRVSLDDATGRVLLFNPENSDHIYLGTLENGVWVSTNAGDQWHPTSLRAGAYNCLAFDPLNSSVMYTASGAVVLKSVDGGLSWATVYTESQPGHTVNCVAVDPASGNTIWATTSGGKIIISNDYGNQWTLISTVPAMEPRLFYVEPGGSGRIFLFTKTSGIFRGDERGKVWTNLSTPLTTLAGATDIRAVAVTDQGWFIATAYGLLKSVDQGAQWTGVTTLVSPTSVPIQSIAVNPSNGQEMFITTDQRLHHTTDAGASWAVTTLPTSRTPYLLTFDPLKNDRLYFINYKPKKK